MSDQVGNPKERFSCIAAKVFYELYSSRCCMNYVRGRCQVSDSEPVSSSSFNTAVVNDWRSSKTDVRGSSETE